MPFKTDSEIPFYLLDFIQNDPNFVPEIHCNNLEDVFLSLHTDEPGHPSSAYSKMFGKYTASKSKRNVMMNPYDNQTESSSDATSMLHSSLALKDVDKKSSKRDQSQTNAADILMVEDKKERGGRIGFKSQLLIFLSLRFKLLMTQKWTLLILFITSLLLFTIMIVTFYEAQQ